MSRLKILTKIRKLGEILPSFLFVITGKHRYKPEIVWSDKSLTHNIFRVYESIFWRRNGIRIEITTVHMNGRTTHQAHTFEGACALLEMWARNLLKFKVVKVWVPQFSSPIGLPIQNAGYSFAIAFDQTANSTGVMNSATDTFNAPTAGSNTELIVNSYASGVGIPTAMTYNSVSMTKRIDTAAGGAPFISQYTLNAPATGTNTVSITTGGTNASHTYAYISVSLTGVLQGSEVGDTDRAFTASGITTTTTTDNSLIVDAIQCNGTVTAATVTGTGQVKIGATVSSLGVNNTNAMTSYETTTTAGSYTTAWSITGGGIKNTTLVEIKPFIATASTGSTLLLMGV